MEGDLQNDIQLNVLASLGEKLRQFPGGTRRPDLAPHIDASRGFDILPTALTSSTYCCLSSTTVLPQLHNCSA